jgi:hypothetical protein
VPMETPVNVMKTRPSLLEAAVGAVVMGDAIKANHSAYTPVYNMKGILEIGALQTRSASCPRVMGEIAST